MGIGVRFNIFLLGIALNVLICRVKECFQPPCHEDGDGRGTFTFKYFLLRIS